MEDFEPDNFELLEDAQESFVRINSRIARIRAGDSQPDDTAMSWNVKVWQTVRTDIEASIADLKLNIAIDHLEQMGDC